MMRENYLFSTLVLYAAVHIQCSNAQALAAKHNIIFMVKSGAINGLIFYAIIVSANQNTFFPPDPRILYHAMDQT